MHGHTNILHAATKIAVAPRCDNWTANENLGPATVRCARYFLFASTTCVTFCEGTCAILS